MNTGFKWIEVKPGTYRTVPLDDERPAVKLRKKKGIPYIVEKPSWAGVRDMLMPDPGRMDADGETTAIDAMLETREQETAHSPKWREWEKGRKKEWQRNKPAAMKEKAYQENKRRIKQAKEIAGI